MRTKIPYDELVYLLGGKKYVFPKYTTQLLNLANANSGGTRPKVVGQMSELIQAFEGKTLTEWVDWYSERKPDAVREAADRISAMLTRLREAMGQIDDKMIEDWVKDLIHNKTFAGLRFQEAILQKISEETGTTYRLSTAEEETKGIDGFVGGRAISIKPHTYRSKKDLLGESIEVTVVYYEKKKDGIVIECDI
jgi:hypothetical protein